MKTEGIGTWQGYSQMRTEYSLTYENKNISQMMVQKTFWVSQVMLGPLAAVFQFHKTFATAFEPKIISAATMTPRTCRSHTDHQPQNQPNHNGKL
jgi:hypothetical protein